MPQRSMPDLGPNLDDGGNYESSRYPERREDLGRRLHPVLIEARGGLAKRGEPSVLVAVFQGLALWTLSERC